MDEKIINQYSDGEGNETPRPERAQASERVSPVRRSLQVSEAKVFIGDQEIGISSDLDFDIQCEGNKYKMPIFEPIEASFEIKMDDPEKIYRYFKSWFKMPRKMKKRIFGTRKAKNKLLKMIKAGLPVTYKHFKRAGLEVKIPANFA